MPVQDVDVRAAVQNFLELIEVGAGSVEASEARLPLALDRLAMAQHAFDDVDADVDGPDAPTQDAGALRALICERFPNYGFYNCVNATAELGEAKLGVGDAIDDLLDIAKSLFDVEWYWANVSETEALWHLRFGYQTHWEGHLRGLQLYLHELRFEDAERVEEEA